MIFLLYNEAKQKRNKKIGLTIIIFKANNFNINSINYASYYLKFFIVITE